MATKLREKNISMYKIIKILYRMKTLVFCVNVKIIKDKRVKNHYNKKVVHLIIITKIQKGKCGKRVFLLLKIKIKLIFSRFSRLKWKKAEKHNKLKFNKK
jgi:hypothetical protein